MHAQSTEENTTKTMFNQLRKIKSTKTNRKYACIPTSLSLNCEKILICKRLLFARTLKTYLKNLFVFSKSTKNCKKSFEKLKVSTKTVKKSFEKTKITL